MQDMPRAGASLILEMSRFVRDELGIDWQNASLLVALSGGIDSTALLVMLCGLRDIEKFTLTAAHLDHGLRLESKTEAIAVRNLCESLNVQLVERHEQVGEIAKNRCLGLEEAARKVRYAFLEEARAAINADWILTGHHVGDLAEDVLLRLTRGTSWPGLGGMRAVHGNLLRPLLLIEKSHLINLLESLELSWNNDMSNEDLRFRRNRIRHDVLPFFLTENPDFYDTVRTLWRSARLDESFWDEYLTSVFPDCELNEGNLVIPRDVLNSLPPAARIRLFVRIIQTVNRGQARANTLYALEKNWRLRKNDRLFQFSGEVQAQITREGIYWSVKS